MAFERLPCDVCQRVTVHEVVDVTVTDHSDHRTRCIEHRVWENGRIDVRDANGDWVTVPTR